MTIQGKRNKTCKANARKLHRPVKESRWEKKKWKTHVSAPRSPSKRSLGTRRRSSLQDPLDDMALEEVVGNGIPLFSPFNSLASNDVPYDFGDCIGAEGGLSVEHQTLQAEGEFSTVYVTSQAREAVLQANTDNSAGPENQALRCVERCEQQLARPRVPMLCGGNMGQRLVGNTPVSAETELAPSMQVLTTDSGVVTAEEHFEDSLVEVTPHSRDDTLEVTSAAHSHERRSAHSHERRAAHNHEALAARNQARIFHNQARAARNQAQAAHNQAQAAQRQAAHNQRLIIQQEVAEADDVSIGNPLPGDVDIHNDGIQLMYQHRALGWDVDLRAIRRIRSQYRRRLKKCGTCFQGQRQTFNLPCGCFCNCLECDRVMINCSMCQRPIRASVRCSLAT